MNRIDSLISQKRKPMLINFEAELSFFSDKTIVITGGTGFIGSALVRRLAPVAKQIHILAQHSSNTHRIEQVLGNVHLHRVVLDKGQSISTQIPEVKPDIAVHFAQPSGYQLGTLSEYINSLEISTRMTTNMLEYARETGVERLIHICSSTVYGAQNESVFTESGPYRPDTFRGLVKYNERNLCHYFARKYDLPVNLARVFRAYGPYDSAHKLIVKTLNKHNDGASIDLVADHIIRDYIHVDDIVLFIAKMCEAPLSPGEEINLAGGKSYNAREIVTCLEQILDTTDLISKNSYASSEVDHTFKQADISKAKKMLHWEPKIDLRFGLNGVVTWYQNQQKD